MLFSQLDEEKELRTSAESESEDLLKDVARLKRKLESSERNENNLTADATHWRQNSNSLTKKIQQLHKEKAENDIIVKNEIAEMDRQLSSMNQQNNSLSR